MTTLSKRLLLVAFICLAILFYTIGSKTGALAFIIMGCVLEIAFWIGIFGRGSNDDPAA